MRFVQRFSYAVCVLALSAARAPAEPPARLPGMETTPLASQAQAAPAGPLSSDLLDELEAAPKSPFSFDANELSAGPQLGERFFDERDEEAGETPDWPDIDSPGPDLGDFPNSAYTLPKGRAYI